MSQPVRRRPAARSLAALLLTAAASTAPFAVAQAQPQQSPPTFGQPAAPPGSPVDPVARAARDAIPLTPELIQELARRYQQNSQAQEQAFTQVATPGSRRVSVSFQPGAATTIIETVRGYPTALSFFDNTGQPWPIAWDTSSNAAGGGGGGSGGNCNTSAAATAGAGGPAAEVVGFHSCVPVRGSNVLQITPMSLSPRGGMLVSLQNAPKPIAFLVVPGPGRYDADVSIQIADRGPNARVRIDTRPGVPVTGAPYLNAMLAGVAPADARPLTVEGVSPDEVRAWRLGDELYLRTRHTLMAPPWSASENGEGGVTIYALPAVPVVLMSVNGRTVSAQLKE